MSRFPAMIDLKARARRRLPRFVWDFLDSGTGTEATQRRNRAALDAVLLMPSVLHGEIACETAVEFLGARLDLPVGMAPVGMSGLVWPDAERLLARAAARAGIPRTCSRRSGRTPGFRCIRRATRRSAPTCCAAPVRRVSPPWC